MTQSLLIKKIQCYLTFCSEQHAGKSPEKLKKRIDELKSGINNGACHILTIIHGIMELDGHLEWWETVLHHLCEWDEKKETLNKKIRLFVKGKIKEYTLGQLFERAANYIIFSQAKYLFHSQKKERLSLEFSHRTNKGDVVKKAQVIRNLAGYITKEYLIKLLGHYKNTFAKKVCRISNHTHAIRFAYRPDTDDWIVYDPNYDHTLDKSNPNKPIYQRFKNHLSAAEEIYSILQSKNSENELSGLSIEVASFENKEFVLTHSKAMLQTNGGMELLQKDGLAALARSTPELLEELIALNEKNDNPNFKKFIEVLFDSLEFTDKHNRTAIYWLSLHKPQFIIKLVQYANRTHAEHIKALIAKTLVMPAGKKGNTIPLHAMIERMPDDKLCDFFAKELATDSVDSSSFKSNITTFRGNRPELRIKKPLVSDDSIAIAEEDDSSSLSITIAKTLISHYKNGSPYLTSLLLRKPEILSDLLNIVSKLEDKNKLIIAIANILISQKTPGKNLLETICFHAPQSLTPLLELTHRLSEGRQLYNAIIVCVKKMLDNKELFCINKALTCLSAMMIDNMNTEDRKDIYNAVIGAIEHLPYCDINKLEDELNRAENNDRHPYHCLYNHGQSLLNNHGIFANKDKTLWLMMLDAIKVRHEGRAKEEANITHRKKRSGHI